MTTLPASPALLILPHLRIQNANAISSPLTHGFPSMTAFLGFMWALERKLASTELGIALQSVGVICHHHEEQTTQGGYVKAFRLMRHPVSRDGSTAAIVEEGRVHLDVTLVFGVDGSFVGQDDDRRQAIADGIAHVVAGMRIAGGSVMPSAHTGRKTRPMLKVLGQDADAAASVFRRLRRHWLPGFALVCRDDLLQRRITSLQASHPEASALDAWLDLSRFNWRSQRDETTDEVRWTHDRNQGWIVPIPVGYGAVSDSHAPAAVQNARDTTTRFRFVESLYSIGQWISPHRLSHPGQLLWYAHNDEDIGLYRCRNDYAHTATASDD